jgi:hypothetical protein
LGFSLGGGKFGFFPAQKAQDVRWEVVLLSANILGFSGGLRRKELKEN